MNLHLIMGLFFLKLLKEIASSSDTQFDCSYKENDLASFVSEIESFSQEHFEGAVYFAQIKNCSNYFTLMKQGYNQIKNEYLEIAEIFDVQNDNDKNENLVLSILTLIEHEKLEKQKLRTSLQKHKEKLLEYFSNRMNNHVYDEAEDFLHVIYGGNVDNSKMILDEIKNFIDDATKVSAFEYLYGEMLVNNHLNTFQALILKCFLKNLAEEAMIFPFTYFEESYKDHARHIVYNLEGPTKYVMEKMRQSILLDHYQEIVDLSDEYEYGFNSVLKEFVIYCMVKDKKTAKNLIILANFMPSVYLKGVILSETYSKMSENDLLLAPELVMLAYSVKNAMNTTQFVKLSYSEKRLLDDLKSRLPEGLNNIFWDKICLKNVYSSKYLAVETSKSEVTGRNVSMSAEKHSLWMFETTDYGKSFTIKSMGYNEYLMGNENLTSNLYVDIILTEFDQADKWAIEQITKDQYYLKNLKHDSYLSVSESNPEHILMTKLDLQKNQKVIKWEFQKVLQSYFSSFFG